MEDKEEEKRGRRVGGLKGRGRRDETKKRRQVTRVIDRLMFYEAALEEIQCADVTSAENGMWSRCHVPPQYLGTRRMRAMVTVGTVVIMKVVMVVVVKLKTQFYYEGHKNP